MGVEARISSDTRFARAEGLISANVGLEVVMLHTGRNAYYDTDSVGAEIWHLLEVPQSVESIVTQLLQRFDVARDICERDVIGFLSDALAEDVVQVVHPDH